MENESDIEPNVVHTGDCLDVLAELPDKSVHSVMTSPPYWNLRDYDHDDQLGLERSSDDYVQNIAEVMDKVKEVLRDDGSLWLNLGDTYDNKNLQQIPGRVAIELQERGWILRNRVTWAKPNPMPQSVKDRLNDTTEAVFHFVKDKDYWYDLDAVREPHETSTEPRQVGGAGATEGIREGNGKRVREGRDYQNACHPAGKNPGDVFEITTKPFPEAHFAVYPLELCETPIKATVPPKVCVDCGSPYEREVVETKRELPDTGKVWIDHMDQYLTVEAIRGNSQKGDGDGDTSTYLPNNRNFKGWENTCDCDTDTTESGIILDPFAGAGTTLLKAKELGRKFIGIELNPEYADMARARVGLSPHDPSNVRADDAQSGLEAYE